MSLGWGELDLEERGEGEHQKFASLFLLLELGFGIIEWVGRKIRGEYLSYPLEIGTAKNGRPKHLVCYRAGDAIGWVDLQELREKGGPAVGFWLPWPGWPVWSQGVLAEVGGWDKATGSGRKFSEGKIYVITGDEVNGRIETAADGLLQGWGWDWGIGFGGAEGEVKICSQPTCFPGWNLKTNLYVLFRYLSFSKAKCLGEISFCSAADGSLGFQD